MMMLISLITVFMITEVLIGREMMGKETAIGQLQRIIGHLEGLVWDADKEAARLRNRVQELESTASEQDKLLAQLRDERAALSADKSKAEQTVTSVQEQVALLSARAEQLAAGTGATQSCPGGESTGFDAARRGHRSAERPDRGTGQRLEEETAGTGGGTGEIR